MSLLHLLFDLAEDPFLGDFGNGLHPSQLIRPTLSRQSNVKARNLWPQLYSGFWLPHNNKATRQSITLNKSNCGKDGFQVSMDVQHFQPNEIIVKTVNNTVVIEAKHEEKEDEFGQIYRHFIRRYELPTEIDVNEVVSMLSSDGVLTIKAPPKIKIADSDERVIAIQQTGPAHLTVIPNEMEATTISNDKTSE